MRVFYIVGPNNVCFYSANITKAINYLCAKATSLILVEPGEVANLILGHALINNSPATIQIVTHGSTYEAKSSQEVFLFRDSTQGFDISRKYPQNSWTNNSALLITYKRPMHDQN